MKGTLREATCGLRIVERTVSFVVGNNLEVQTLKVLQQAWNISEIGDLGTVSYPKIEWIDVPIVQEAAGTLDRFNQISTNQAGS